VKLTNRHVGSPGAPDRSGEVGDGHADRVAPLGPRAVVLSHFVAEDLREHKPRVAAPLADPAVNDDGPAAVDADGGVELPQLLDGLKRPVFVDREVPRHVDGARNVPRPDGKLLHAFGDADAVLVLGPAADIEAVDVLAGSYGLPDVRQEDAKVRIGFLDGVVAGRTAGPADRKLAPCGLPLGAVAVEEAHVFHPVIVK